MLWKMGTGGGCFTPAAILLCSAQGQRSGYNQNRPVVNSCETAVARRREFLPTLRPTDDPWKILDGERRTSRMPVEWSGTTLKRSCCSSWPIEYYFPDGYRDRSAQTGRKLSAASLFSVFFEIPFSGHDWSYVQFSP